MARREWLWVPAAIAAGVGAAWARRWNLRGRHVLVTGGSRGLGLELARELVRHGARVTLCARDEAELARAVAVLGGAEVLAVPCDIANRDDVRRLVETARARFGPIDALINNAGTIQVGPHDTMTVEDYEHAMAVHFYGPLHAILEVLPEMRARRSGRIVDISSIGGIVAVPHLLPYVASKFALRGLSLGLRAELARDGIRVVTVCPGLMRTGSARNAWFKGRHRAEFAWFQLGDATPLTSMNAARAARRIVRALRRGESHLVLSWQAKALALVSGLFPGGLAAALGLVNRLLPPAGGIGTSALRGRDSASRLTSPLLTALDDRAARRNNEVAPPTTP